MARKALIVKSDRKRKIAARRKKDGKKVKFPTRVYNRCGKCGRIGGYMRFFGVCRICFLHDAREGKVMGVTKSSW